MFHRIFRLLSGRKVPPVFEGEVIYSDTRRPVPMARVAILASDCEPGCSMHETVGQTDAVGRFRITPRSGKFFYVTVHPPEGKPYLIVQKRIELANRAEPPKIEVALPPGILVRGKIIETDSGRPVARASILYEEHPSRSYAPERVMPGWAPHEVMVESDADGAFRIAVPPGRGILFVQGPRGDYIRQMVGTGQLYHGTAGGRRCYFSAHVPLDLKFDEEPAALEISIRRGVPINGRIVGPEDRPVNEVRMLSRLSLQENSPTFQCWAVVVKKGELELHGLDPDASIPVYFLDPKNQLGATVEISGKSAEKGPLVVRLSPCGKAVARFVDPKGQPLAKYDPYLRIVVTSGPLRAEWQGYKTELELWSDEGFVANFAQMQGPVTDKQGYCAFPALIPGATYRVPIFRNGGYWGAKDFSVKPGETLQLPDITEEIERRG